MEIKRKSTLIWKGAMILLIAVLGFFALKENFGRSPTGNVIAIVNGATDSAGEKQVINLEVRGLDYFPNKFTIKKGVSVEWRVDGRAAQGCAQIINVPKLGIFEQLPRDQIKTITFTPRETGKITFTYSMGMAGPGIFEVVA